MYKMSSSDLMLVERLRKENLEQFLTLVRMHLSFVVDINTDDVDSSTDKPKQFRWNFHKKTKNTCVNSSQNNAGSTKNTAEGNSITEDGILRLNELIDFLALPENVTQEGIFRRTGSLSRQHELRQLLLNGSSLDLDESKFSVHDCASVLKGFLADLPQPLLMDQYYQTYCTLAAQYPPNAESSETKLLTALQLLLLLLTPSHRSFLQRLLTLLRLVADNEASNRMSPDTLATMFTPHLLCPRKLSPETFHTDALALSPVISFMIRQSPRLFTAPHQLATDAAAYFTARERRHSTDGDLDESITDRTAANTVYTFVDRPRTAAENETNPTDTALAQLYAHIQALPDSQHKRRLIKHFNRQNGYGTPIQIQRTGKVAGSRSFGDSIKRHIFNKGLLNKTPKKGSGSGMNAVEEKSPAKGKLRFTDDAKIEVSHKNIVLKNLANKIASTDSLDGNQDYDSDTSNESTLSDGALNQVRKISPKFVSEPNLSVLETEETPKNTKKRTRLFRSKLATHVNKKYQKRSNVIRGTPTCVSCFDDQDTGSETEVSVERSDVKESSLCNTPTKNRDEHLYLTSTPGVCQPIPDEESSTPYSVHFRRASMSPITKSTQKLSKAMQESIMTPRSRKPLIITSEKRDSLPENSEEIKSATKCDVVYESATKCDVVYKSATKCDVVYESATKCDVAYESATKSDIVYESMSLKNDSDFVSSDDDMVSRSSYSFERSYHSNTSKPSKTSACARPLSIVDASLRSENTRFVLSHERPNIENHEEKLTPNFKISEQVTDHNTKSLTEPFREYLLSRSVLTATPIDLSILNKSTDADERLTDSLMYCLNGNVPSDLTSSIGNLAVDKHAEEIRTPMISISNHIVNSPKRKRCASVSSKDSTEIKKAMVEKENGSEEFQIRETEL